MCNAEPLGPIYGFRANLRRRGFWYSLAVWAYPKLAALGHTNQALVGRVGVLERAVKRADYLLMEERQTESIFVVRAVLWEVTE